MFQSKEPFALPAIVAYVSSLSLTIILFSAPYFASYFINYYKKLHQIEEAIVLLSEQTSVGNTTLASDTPTMMPEYSAVSFATGTDLELDSKGFGDQIQVRGTRNAPPTLADDRGNGPDAQEGSSIVGSTEMSTDTALPVGELQTVSIEAEDVVAIEELAEELKTKRKSISAKEAFLNQNQMDLFGLDVADSNSEGFLGETVEAEVIDMGEKRSDNKSNDAKTEIHAFVLIDSGSKLFIRGDFPFSWEKGVELMTTDVGKFSTEPFDLENKIDVAFLMDDDPKQMSSVSQIESGVENECYPEF